MCTARDSCRRRLGTRHATKFRHSRHTTSPLGPRAGRSLRAATGYTFHVFERQHSEHPSDRARRLRWQRVRPKSARRVNHPHLGRRRASWSSVQPWQDRCRLCLAAGTGATRIRTQFPAAHRQRQCLGECCEGESSGGGFQLRCLRRLTLFQLSHHGRTVPLLRHPRITSAERNGLHSHP